MTNSGIHRLRPLPMRLAKAPGFTLVELLISIVIVAILASIAVPSYREFVIGQRIRTASFDLMAAITLTRSEAIKRNASPGVPVTIAPTGGAWENGWSVNYPAVVPPLLLQQGALGSGVTVTCKDGSPPATVACPAGGFSYSGSGRLTAGFQADVPSLEIGSASSTLARCISIDLGGRPNSRMGKC